MSLKIENINPVSCSFVKTELLNISYEDAINYACATTMEQDEIIRDLLARKGIQEVVSLHACRNKLFDEIMLLRRVSVGRRLPEIKDTIFQPIAENEINNKENLVILDFFPEIVLDYASIVGELGECCFIQNSKVNEKSLLIYKSHEDHVVIFVEVGKHDGGFDLNISPSAMAYLCTNKKTEIIYSPSEGGDEAGIYFRSNNSACFKDVAALNLTAVESAKDVSELIMTGLSLAYLQSELLDITRAKYSFDETGHFLSLPEGGIYHFEVNEFCPVWLNQYSTSFYDSSNGYMIFAGVVNVTIAVKCNQEV